MPHSLQVQALRPLHPQHLDIEQSQDKHVVKGMKMYG